VVEQPRLEAPGGVVISRYEETDRAALIEFRRHHYGAGAPQADPAYVDWQFRDAPGVRERGAPLWIARKDGSLVGTIARIRTSVRIGEEEVPAAWAVDFAVRADLRKSGIGEALAVVSRREPAVRLVMESATATQGITARTGYRLVCDVPLFVRPLQPARWLQTHRVPRALALLSSPLLPLLAALDDRALRNAHKAGIELVETRSFDDRADRLVADLSPHYPVICRRDRAWLEWRFERHPLAHRYRLHWLVAHGRTVGYAVLREGAYRGAPAGVLVDYLCAPELIGPLLARCIERFREARAAVISCLHLNPAGARAFWGAGFLRRRSGWPFLAQPDGASARATRLLVDPDSWFATAGDSNVDRDRPA